MHQREAEVGIVRQVLRLAQNRVIDVGLLFGGQRAAEERKQRGFEQTARLVRQNLPEAVPHTVVLHGHRPPGAVAQAAKHAARRMKPFHQGGVDAQPSGALENIGLRAPGHQVSFPGVMVQL
jgi:hypothetical protein